MINISEPPSAIICISDAIAISCIDELLSLGIKIPEDMRISGFDNIGLASHNSIRLTSIGYEKGHIGEIAMQNLIELIEQKEAGIESTRHITLTPELFIRESTRNNHL